MKIISVYYTDKPGGFCKRLYRLLDALAAREHEVIYLTLDPDKAKTGQGVTTIRIPFPLKTRKGLLFWLIYTLWCPVYLLWKSMLIKPERFVVFGSYYSSMVAPARWALRIPTILFLRSLAFTINRITGVSPWICKIAEQIDKFGISQASTVVCMTQSMHRDVESFLGYKLSNVHHLLNDLPHKREIKTPPALPQLQLLSAGVLDARKNMKLLINAFRILESEGIEDLTLKVAGDGPLLEEFRSSAPDNVTFLGWESDMTNVYNRADLLIHPAIHEGVPNVVLEALAKGLPVLGAAIPEMEELLVHQELLFDPEDEKKLAEKIKKMSVESAVFGTISKLSMERADQLSFDWDAEACALVTNESMQQASKRNRESEEKDSYE